MFRASRASMSAPTDTPGNRSTASAVQGEIDDKAAVEFAQQFYQLYAAGMSVAQAFEEAKLAIDYRQAERLVLRSK